MRSLFITCLFLTLTTLGCPGTDPSNNENCEGEDCASIADFPSAGLHEIPNAPYGIPIAWVAESGEWRIIIHSQEGLYYGTGVHPKTIEWKTLIEWENPLLNPVVAFDAKEGPDGVYYAVFAGEGALWYFDSSSLPLARTIVESNIGENPQPSIGLGQDSRVHITYFNEPLGVLRYATLDSNTGWEIESVPLPASPCEGEDCDEVLPYGADSDIGIQGESPVVAFYDQSRGNLCFSARISNTWVGQIMDGETQRTGVNTGDVGKWPSLSLDKKGNLSIAYYGVTSSDLRFAAPSNGQLLLQQVDPGVVSETDFGLSTDISTGAFAQLVPGATGQPVIFYLDSHTPTVRRAERKGEVWYLSSLPLVSPGGFHMSGSTGARGERLLVFQTWHSTSVESPITRSMMAWYEPAQ